MSCRPAVRCPARHLRGTGMDQNEEHRRSKRLRSRLAIHAPLPSHHTHRLNLTSTPGATHTVAELHRKVYPALPPLLEARPRCTRGATLVSVHTHDSDPLKLTASSSMFLHVYRIRHSVESGGYKNEAGAKSMSPAGG